MLRLLPLALPSERLLVYGSSMAGVDGESRKGVATVRLSDGGYDLLKCTGSKRME